mmetsp:Transcript_44107/g.117034  ORF Transcript_44107/g.117034 Transcript_44107/m.117034 type:complete len:331 (-) Transcript_44107:940-1932(-)
MYRNHKKTNNAEVAYFSPPGPPSSAPRRHLRATSRARHISAHTVKIVTLMPSDSAGTTKVAGHSSLISGSSSHQPTFLPCTTQGSESSRMSTPVKYQYREPMHHGMPSPRNTLTELLPVTLPMLLSAVASWTAAVMEAKVSGRDVPMATTVIAVMESSQCSAQPNMLAKSPMIAVRPPISTKDTMKHNIPSQRLGGGTIADITFHGIMTMWLAQAPAPAWPSSLSKITASLNCSLQLWLPAANFCELGVMASKKGKSQSSCAGSPKIVTVRMQHSSDPSVLASKRAPPLALSMMSRNCPVFTPRPLGKISNSMLFCPSPGAKCRTPLVAL